MKNFQKNSLVSFILLVSLVFSNLFTFLPRLVSASSSISVGTSPQYSILVGTDIYVNNYGSNNVSVINTNTNVVTDTITVGTGPSSMILVGSDVYVTNFDSTDVSVIDTNTNTVTDTITVGTRPLLATLVGTDLYVINVDTSNVSVIDTNTNTVTDTITVGTSPYSSTLVSTDLYVMNYDSSNVSVIDTNTNTVTDTIVVGTTPLSSTLVGTDLYVNNGGDTSVSVIDTNTNTVTDTIVVGTTPLSSTLVGTDLYVNNGGDTSVSVIDTNTNTVTDTIVVGTTPLSSTLVGTDLYVMNYDSTSVSVIDTSTNTVVKVGPPVFVSAIVEDEILTISYDMNLDTGSVPDEGDFVVNVNAVPVSVDSVGVVGDTVVLTLVAPILRGTTVDISYTIPVSNPIQDFSGVDAVALVNESVTNDSTNCSIFNVGTNPWSSVLVGTDLYVGNYGSDNVSVVDTITNEVTATITVGDSPRFATLAGTNLYIVNRFSNSVSVIDTTSNTVIASVAIGDGLFGGPFSSTLVGTDLYVNNFNYNTIDVIDTNTNTVTDTITVGTAPKLSLLIGTDLYVLHQNSHNVKVVDTLTNTVTATIAVGTTPSGLNLSGTDLYIINSAIDNVSVIDINTNTVTDTLAVGDNPVSATLVGTDLYVLNRDSDNVSVIDTNTNSVTDTIIVGDFPNSSILAGTDLYVVNQNSDNVKIINTLTNTVTDTITVGTDPQYPTLVGTDLYIHNYGSDNVSIIDTLTQAGLACTFPTLTYVAGSGGSISGNTSQTVILGADGTAVTAVPDDGYEFINWSDASTINPRTDTNVTGDITVTANFSQTSNGSSSGSNPSRIIDIILDIVTPPEDPVVTTPPDVISPPVEPVVPVEPVIPVVPTEEIVPVITPITPVVSTNENNNEDSSVDVPVIENISLVDRISSVIKDPVGNVISRGIALFGLAFGILVALFSSIGSIADIGLNLLRLWSLFLYGVGLKKRNRPWGVVYDSVTKQPLDPVYVVLLDLKGQEIATSITDMDGRYGFLVEPGVYKIKVNKNNYNFPSEKLMGKSSDELYSDIYWGDYFEIKNQGEVIAKNIPMDPIGFNWNEFAKKEQGKMKYYHTRDVIISRLSDIFSIVGFLTSFVILLVLPQPYNVIVFCLYLILFTLRRTKLLRNKKGNVINDKTGIPLSYGILRVYSIATGVEVAHRVLDKKGNYYMLIGNGTYTLSLEKKNDDMTYSKVYGAQNIEIKHGILTRKFRI